MTKRTKVAQRSYFPILLAVVGLSISTGAVARQPSKAQISAIRSSCQADYPAHCAGVPTGGAAALACLQKNMANLSPACQTAVNAVGGGPSAEPITTPPQPSTVAPAVAPGAPAVSTVPAAPARQYPPMAPRQELAILRYSCGSDFRALCGGVQFGGGRAIACLRDNGSSLSPRCRSALMGASRR